MNLRGTYERVRVDSESERTEYRWFAAEPFCSMGALMLAMGAP